MDFVTHLLWTSRKHDAIWVIVDRLTKSAHFLAVRITFTLEEFCRLYIREIVRLHGVPVSIVSDRDPGLRLSSGRVSRRAWDTTFNEYRFSSSDGWSIRADYSDFKGHAVSMRPGSQG